MVSNVFVSKGFIDFFYKKLLEFNGLDLLEPSIEKLNHQKIGQIIANSNLQLNYSYLDIINDIKENEDPIKAALLNKIIKTAYVKRYDQKKDYSLPNSVFLDEDVNCSQTSSKYNVLNKGVNYDFKGEFFKNPLRTVFDAKMNSDDISNIYHLCKNIVLIDPYIFADDFKKRNSLVNFLDTCFNFKNGFVKKHLTIVSELPTNTKDKDFVKNKVIRRFIKSLSGELNIDEENVTVFRHVGSAFGNNRHLITDYALMDLQHVFDRNHGVITGIYFYNNKIDKHFNDANKLIDHIKKLYADSEIKYIKAANAELKDSNIKFGNMLNNCLFN